LQHTIKQTIDDNTRVWPKCNGLCLRAD